MVRTCWMLHLKLFVCTRVNGHLWKGAKRVTVGFRFSGSCDLPEVNNLVAITLSEAAHASQDKCTVQWHLFCVFTCRVHSVFLSVPHINTDYSTRDAKQAGPSYPCLVFITGLIDTDDEVVFWPLPVCNNMLVTAISFPISGLLFCHFSPWSSVNSRAWLLNYYSGLYNGVDSRNILPFYFLFFDNWVWFARVWSGIANTSWLYYINLEGILPKKWIQY